MEAVEKLVEKQNIIAENVQVEEKTLISEIENKPIYVKPSLKCSNENPSGKLGANACCSKC